MKSPYYTPEHEAFRASLRRVVDKEIAPFAEAWDEAGEFPRELYKKAAAIGLLGLGFAIPSLARAQEPLMRELVRKSGATPG